MKAMSYVTHRLSRARSALTLASGMTIEFGLWLASHRRRKQP